MNPKHLHSPLSTRARCPACHEAVYSRAGIHPQCAVRQSEPPKSKAKPAVDAENAEGPPKATDQTEAATVVA